MRECLIGVRLIDRGPVARRLRRSLQAPPRTVREPEMLVPGRLMRREPALEVTGRLKIRPEVLVPLLQRLLPRLRRVHHPLTDAEEPRCRAPVRGLRLHEC